MFAKRNGRWRRGEQSEECFWDVVIVYASEETFAFVERVAGLIAVKSISSRCPSAVIYNPRVMAPFIHVLLHCFVYKLHITWRLIMSYTVKVQ